MYCHLGPLFLYLLTDFFEVSVVTLHIRIVQSCSPGNRANCSALLKNNALKPRMGILFELKAVEGSFFYE